MQKYYLITQDTYPTLISAAIGIILYLFSRILESPIKNKILSVGLDNFELNEGIIHFETSYSRWCERQYKRGPNQYNFSIDVLRVTGYWFIALAGIIQFGSISLSLVSIPIGAMPILSYFTLKTPTIESRVLLILQHDAEDNFIEQ